jgi:hypothetical protein
VKYVLLFVETEQFERDFEAMSQADRDRAVKAGLQVDGRPRRQDPRWQQAAAGLHGDHGSAGGPSSPQATTGSG